LTDHRSILATALGITACHQGHRVLYATAVDWIHQLKNAHDTGRLEA
jgi:DNA replication protein DnaC